MLVHRQGRELATDRGNPRVIELGFKGEEEIGDGSIAAGSLAPSSLDVGRLCQRDRWALREMIDSLPMDEDPVCEECLMAFTGPNSTLDDQRTIPSNFKFSLDLLGRRVQREVLPPRPRPAVRS
jgi:hypothetical protein